MKKQVVLGNILAGITILIWGITFISTKILLKDFSPEEILFYRFLIASLVLLIVVDKKVKIVTLKEEVLFAFLGLTGITLYFWVENLALKYTYASNVGLISSAIPIFTALLAHYLTKEEKISRDLILGFVVAMAGIFMVIYNGRVLELNPVGDFLAVITAVLFAIYSVFLNRLNKNFSQLFITRKIFFYGLLFILPIAVINHVRLPNFEKVSIMAAGNIVFLAVFASVLCFLMWNKAVSIIGSVKTTNYIYFVPLVTMISAVIFINEKISPIMIGGGALIIFGVYLNNVKILKKISRRN